MWKGTVRFIWSKYSINHCHSLSSWKLCSNIAYDETEYIWEIYISWSALIYKEPNYTVFLIKGVQPYPKAWAISMIIGLGSKQNCIKSTKNKISTNRYNRSSWRMGFLSDTVARILITFLWVHFMHIVYLVSAVSLETYFKHCKNTSNSLALLEKIKIKAIESYHWRWVIRVY